ncbi:hypothetical protein MRB53_010750 [Persea americana]|uniref:Uncharacterized protein n=1 Tax=Persea americana TaxID=3435 RepID=A0ACC2LTF2_PERAE|nr:hypothetical protein MRB53_010750 [Persea americana]
MHACCIERMQSNSKINRYSSIDSLHLFSSDLILFSVVRTDVPRHFLCRIYDFVSNYLLKESLISLVRKFLLCSTFWLLRESDILLNLILLIR